MKNCLILGSGRSGTSLAAGSLSNAGYFMGERLVPPDTANPKGYFEDAEINEINEQLLVGVIPVKRAGWFGNTFAPARPVHSQRWLASMPSGASLPSRPDLEKRISKITQRQPFCFKDPRFCYTLDAWLPFAKDALLLCVFRHPGITAISMVKEAQRDSAARQVIFNFDFKNGIEVWCSMYRHLLHHHEKAGDWIFVHYNQFVDGTVFPKLAGALGVNPDRSFVDASLSRSTCEEPVPEEAMEMYRRLSALAAYQETC